MKLMQNKNNWFSDAIYLDHVTDMIKSNQRGEGLNKDWNPGDMGAAQHLLPAAVVAGGMAGKKIFDGAKKVAGDLINRGTKELDPEEDGPIPAGYAPPNRKFKVEGREKVVGGASPKKIVPVDTKAASMSGNEASPIKKSFFNFAVYPEEVGRQDNYSLRKSGPPRQPEYVEAPKRPVLAKPTFFETAVWPHEAGHADHYLRKGIVPLDRFGFRKAKEGWEDGPPVDPEAGALEAHRMAGGPPPEKRPSDSAPFVPKPPDVRESEAARDSAIRAGTYGPDGDTSRSKPAFVPKGRPAPADDGGDPKAKAAEHFDSLLDHAKVQNDPSSSPRERNASAAKIGDAIFKMKKLIPHMGKPEISDLVTALRNGDMGALDKIKIKLGIAHSNDIEPGERAYHAANEEAKNAEDDWSTYSENGFDPTGERI